MKKENPLKDEKLHIRFLVRSILLLDKILQPLVKRTTGNYREEKALATLLLFVGAIVFVCYKTHFYGLFVFGAFALILSPLFLTAPARNVCYRNFWNNPSGGGFKGNYYNNDK